MKRFTETNKWDDPWFWELSPQAKLLWMFLCDHCDSAGIIQISLKLASSKIGQPVKEQHLAELSSRLHALQGGKTLILSFIRFQYGTLSRACKPHNAVFNSLSIHGLDVAQLETLCKGYPKGLETLQEKDQEKEKDQDKTEGVQGEMELQPSIPGSTAIPEVLNRPDFLEAWKLWLEHLKQKRSPATLHAQDLQLHKLSAMGIEKAIQTINHCIEKNWKSIYEPDNSKTALKPNPRNIGICKPTTGGDYGEAAKRKLARQALEAQNQLASQAQGNGNGSGEVLHGDVEPTTAGPVAGSGW